METLYKSLSVLELAVSMRAELGIESRSLQLTKCWPRSRHHLRLQYETANGRLIAGQWFDDRQRLERVAMETARESRSASAKVVTLPESGLMLQSGGADRRLTTLVRILDRPGSLLIVHRPEQRAVVRLGEELDSPYAKILRPEYADRLVANGRALPQFSDGVLTIPELLDANVEEGITVWSALTGKTLRQLLETAATKESDSDANRALLQTAEAVGRALRALHGSPPPASSIIQDPLSVQRKVQKKLANIQFLLPDLYERCSSLAHHVFANLGMEKKSPAVLLHSAFRDIHIYLADDGAVGFLDIDSLGIGEAAFDLADFVIHLESGVLGKRYRYRDARIVADGLLHGYQPDNKVLARLNFYADSRRLKLALVGALIPARTSLVGALLNQIGRPTLAMKSTLSGLGLEEPVYV